MNSKVTEILSYCSFRILKERDMGEVILHKNYETR